MIPLPLMTPQLLIRLVAVAAIAGAVWFAYDWAYDRGADSVQSKWDSVELARSQESAKIAADALETTKALQASSDKDKEIKNAQIKNLNASLASAIAGLSNRPSRPSTGDMPVNPSTGGGCTGAELFKPDAEFLAREAARGDALQIELQLCYDRYNKARNALK